MIQKERELLDERKRLEDEVKWLDQTLSLLLLTPSSNNLPAQAVAKVIQERKKKMASIVSQTIAIILLTAYNIAGQWTKSFGSEKALQEDWGTICSGSG